MTRRLFSNEDLKIYNHYAYMVDHMKDGIISDFEQQLGFAPRHDQITIESFELSDEGELKQVYFTTESDASEPIAWKLMDDTFYRRHTNLSATREEDLFEYREVKF